MFSRPFLKRGSLLIRKGPQKGVVPGARWAAEETAEVDLGCQHRW